MHTFSPYYRVLAAINPTGLSERAKQAKTALGPPAMNIHTPPAASLIVIMVCSTSKIVSGLLLASDARQSLDDTKVSIVDEHHQKKWTMQDLSTMAKSQTTKNAISYLTSAAQRSGVPELDVDE